MKVKTYELKVDVGIGIDIKDITPLINEIVKDSGISEGIITISVIGSTGSITTIEYEPGVVEDLKRAINRLAPPDEEYMHELAWHDGNGHSHVQAAILGPSESFSIKDGRVILGTWQQIVTINHDVRAKTRKIAVTIIGI